MQFDHFTSLPGGSLNVGDSFDFTVTYSDGSQDSGTTVNGDRLEWRYILSGRERCTHQSVA
jgi:hypothetical protein